MWQKKQGPEQVWAGLSTRGFVLSKMGDSEKVPVLSFSWKLIKLMWHRNKKFVIQPQDSATSSELILLTDSYKQSKYLLKLSQVLSHNAIGAMLPCVYCSLAIPHVPDPYSYEGSHWGLQRPV